MALSESPTTLSAAAGPIQSRASNTLDDRYDPFSCTYLDLRPLVHECTRSRPAELLVDLPAMRTVRLNNTAILGGWLVSRCPHEGTLVRIVLGVSKILTHAWLRAALLGKRTCVARVVEPGRFLIYAQKTHRRAWVAILPKSAQSEQVF